MSAEVAQLEEDRSQYQEQLDLVLSSLRDDPENGELLVLKEELDTALKMIDDSIADLKPSTAKNPHAAASADAPHSPSSGPQTAQSSSSSAAAAAPAATAAASAVPFKLNDTVMARWMGGDRSFYPARITSVTGSKAAPMYTVKYKSYGTIETLRAHDIRPMGGGGNGGGNGGGSAPVNMGKRKAEASPPPPPPGSAATGLPPPPAEAATADTASSFTRPMDRFNSGLVSSAAAQIYPQALQEQQRKQAGHEAGSSTAAGEGPPPKKFKKIKATKQLEAGKSKWQEFNNKSKFGKAAGKKESMFRTPEGIHGRVGFTGSGQTMRKDPTRSRHVYQTNDDLD